MLRQAFCMDKRNLFLCFGLLILVLGLSYFALNHSKDYYNMSMEKLINLAQKDDSEAQFTLGAFYEQGIKTEKQEKEAFYWYTKSANNGNTIAMVNLGYMYNDGTGIDNASEAFKWNLLAAKNGNTSGMFNVARKYEHGIGVDVNIKEAKYWDHMRELQSTLSEISLVY